jgi:uncharacterized Tic20 family protein
MTEQIPSTPAPLTPLSQAEERQWAMFAHMSVLLNLFTGFLGVIAPLGIYLVYKDRSRYVADQSFQAFIFQLVWWVGGGILAGIAWTISGILSAVIIGLLCMPFACILSLLPLAAVGYGIYAGLQANQGLSFKYWLTGDWAESILKNMQ